MADKRRGGKQAPPAAPPPAEGGLTRFLQKQRTAADVAPANKENGGAAAAAAPPPKRAKTAPGLAENQNRTVEEIYQKKSQLEHILLRPDSYVGSVERQSQDHFVYDDEAGRMAKKKLEFVPALYKIFDEILVNAADNLVRCPTQDTIRVEVNKAKGFISVWNNGQGLPVQVHKEHGVHVPELVFGQLLTSDNYDDSEKKVTGGRNGYGAKLTNIFSLKFTVETVDSSAGKWYKQAWEKNMTKRNPPQIKPTNGEEDFTQVTFWPDFARFGMTALEDDIAALMRRRAYDVAATTHGRCKVYLDGQLLDVQSFQDYVGLHLAPDAWRVCEVINDRWEIAIGLTDGAGFQQVSFVNSINTSRGGGHVNYVTDQVVNAVMEKVSKQKGGLAVKPPHVKSYLMVFVNCLIENPAFDSQTKETLTSKRERFGSTCPMPEGLLNQILESGIVEALQEWSKALGKNQLAQHLNKSDLGLQKRLFGVPKLDDANKAGTKEGHECTLILTEGDSAKALAVAGLGVIGRDLYGVFPLRGKLRNVRELSVKQMMENKEIDQVMKIMALDASKEYIDGRGLRYGSIMIMTDQDHDGSHIKGLIINFIQTWFPSLLKVPGFMKEFVTPIVKVSKGDESHTFFTLPEYNAWKEENNDGRGWTSKYYKGLGTSTSEEAREYFADIENHEIQFTYTGPGDDDLIDMAFHPKRADDRKQWIGAVEEGTFVDHSEPTLSYNDFIKKELVLFAKYDVERAIPSMVDGFKPGQRKVAYGVFKRRLTSDMKVAQLAGYVAEHSAYHHGETSLQGTIVGLAQNYVGSNNVNLLIPSGQFGTRLKGGKDHAASRYIYTRLSKATRRLIPEEDDAVLEYLSEEGMKIEPKWYCPVIPLVLVNGADGIGTGWSTSVPNYNPRELIANVRRFIRKEPLEPLVPWYRGFKGSITPTQNAPGRFDMQGVAVKRGRVCLEVTELPVGRWTQDYKEWLMEQLPQQGSEKRSLITEIREYHSENSVHFSLSMTPDKLADAERRGVEKVFHLKGSIATSNMWLFDANGNIKKYESPEHIIRDFAPVRLEIYAKRKESLINKHERELSAISNKAKFIRLVVSGRLEVEQRKTADLIKDMKKHGLQTMREINEPSSPPLSPEEEGGPRGFKYLLSIKMWSLTEDKINKLNDDHKKKEEALEELRKTSLETMWERDLTLLEQALDACDAEDRKEEEAAAKLVAKMRGNEDLLVNKQCVVVVSKSFRAKRVRTSEWKARKRGAAMGGRSIVDKKDNKKGGKGDVAEEGEGEVEQDGAKEDEDALAGVFCCHDWDALLVFSEDGMVYMLQALDVPLAKKMSAPGSALTEFLPELGNHRIAALVTVPHKALKHQTDEFVVLISKNGMVKKVTLDRFRGVKPGKGVTAMTLTKGDELRWAHRASLTSALIMASAEGFLLRCSLGPDFASTGIKSAGHLGMKFRMSGDAVAATGISKLTAKEIEGINKDQARKREKREAANLARNAAADGAAGGDAAGGDTGNAAVAADSAMAAPESVPQAPPPRVGVAGRRKSKAAVDDDDSDNAPEPSSEKQQAAATQSTETQQPSETQQQSETQMETQQLETQQEDSEMPSSTAVTAPEAAGETLPESQADGDVVPASQAVVEGKDSDSEKDEKDDEEDEEDGDRQPGTVVAGASLQEGGSAPSKKPQANVSVPGECVLLVTKQGMGLRVPFEGSKIGLKRRGGKGWRGIKLYGRDEVAGLSVVSGKVEEPLPRARGAFDIWFAEQQAAAPALSDTPAADATAAALTDAPAADATAASAADVTAAALTDAPAADATAAPLADAPAADDTAAAPETVAVVPPEAPVAPPVEEAATVPADSAALVLAAAASEAGACEASQEAVVALQPAGPGPWALVANAARERFNALPEAEREEYERQSEEEKQIVARAVEERKKQDLEEVLFGSERGLILRVPVGGVPIQFTAKYGKRLCKVKDGDNVCVAALLSSIDDETEDGTAVAAETAATPALPSFQIEPKKRPAPKAGGGRPKKEARTATGPPQSPMATKIGNLALTPPSGAGDSARSTLRLRGKQGTSPVALVTQPLGKRSQLAHLAAADARANSARQLVAQHTVRLSILKPKVRLLDKTRRSVVKRSLILTELAAKSAKAAAERAAAAEAAASAEVVVADPTSTEVVMANVAPAEAPAPGEAAMAAGEPQAAVEVPAEPPVGEGMPAIEAVGELPVEGR